MAVCYRCLEVPEHIWFTKSDEQRRRHLTKVMGYECRSESSPTSPDQTAASLTRVTPTSYYVWKLHIVYKTKAQGTLQAISATAEVLTTEGNIFEVHRNLIS